MSKKQNLWMGFLLSVFAILSCDNNNIEYPKIYSNMGLTQKVVTVYTKDGIIYTTTLNDSIISLYGFTIGQQDKTDELSNFTATYLNEKIIVKKKNSSSLLDSLNVFEDDGLIYWEKINKNEMPTSSYNFLKDFRSYQPLYVVDTTISQMKWTKFKECFYLKKSNETLLFPTMSIYMKLNIGNTVSKAIITDNNKFNRSYLSKIGINDTIIVCEYDFIFK